MTPKASDVVQKLPRDEKDDQKSSLCVIGSIY